MPNQSVSGGDLVEQSQESLERWGILGGPASILASRIQSLQAKKAAIC